MKYLLSLIAMTASFVVFSQARLPVVHSTSGQAKFYELYGAVSNWHINPRLKLDVHSIEKLSQPVTIKFKTDIDSISFNLAPGKHKDFIVLLNGKDSCLTRVKSAEMKDFSKLPKAIHDTIPFFINRFNTNYLPVVLNGMDSLLLNLDSGAFEVSITTDALQQKGLQQLALYNTLHDVHIGNRTYKSKIHDIAVAGHEVDGLLGWNVFDGMIVELNYEQHRMIIHSRLPKQIVHDTGYASFNLTFLKNNPFIEATIAEDGKMSKSLFFFDLGYQRAVMLDNDALRAAQFSTEKMPIIKKGIMHGTKGNEIPVITASLETLRIGKFEFRNIPAQLVTQSKPMPGVNVHYLGSDVLKRFNTVLDFQKNRVYLKPNCLYDTAYADQKNNGG